MRKVRGAILISIVVTTVVAVVVEADRRPRRRVGRQPDGLVAQRARPSAATSSACPSFDTLGEFDLFGAFGSAGTGVLAALLLVFSLLLADFFDTMGTMTAIGAEAGLNDEEGTPPDAQRILVVDSVAAIAGGAAGVSSNTSYIESASGVGEGARTGPGVRRHRCAVPARHLLHAARRGHPVRGGRPGAGAGRAS